jgi:hypothetical protein
MSTSVVSDLTGSSTAANLLGEDVPDPGVAVDDFPIERF